MKIPNRCFECRRKLVKRSYGFACQYCIDDLDIPYVEVVPDPINKNEISRIYFSLKKLNIRLCLRPDCLMIGGWDPLVILHTQSGKFDIDCNNKKQIMSLAKMALTFG